jgi:oxygen-independent coproporphyrinogen-3 oxidase
MAAPRGPFSLYIHIPYCARKCPYCDFNVHVVAEIPERNYARALLTEMAARAETDDWRGRTVNTVFFGGGTPSIFSPETIAELLERITNLFPVEPKVEITLEANPEDRRRFPGYRAAGVTRLSVGAQTFQPWLLKFLGRSHSTEDVREAVKTAATAFENFNLDLIYAIPGQSLNNLEADLRDALGFAPPHVSAYNLTIEEGTVFHRARSTGSFQLPAEETQVAMARLIEEGLAAAGLRRYEISNYARTGFESLHNSNYWRCGDYLGVGAGAHSHSTGDRRHTFGRRYSNERDPRRYMTSVSRSGTAEASNENLDLRRAATEFMFMGLRMIQGISRLEFARRFDRSPEELYPEIADWTRRGLMERRDDRLRFTDRGLMIADSLFTSFV